MNTPSRDDSEVHSDRPSILIHKFSRPSPLRSVGVAFVRLPEGRGPIITVSRTPFRRDQAIITIHGAYFVKGSTYAHSITNDYLPVVDVNSHR